MNENSALRQAEQLDQKFLLLESNPPEEVGFRDIPWPITHSGHWVLLCISRTAFADAALRKQAYKRASLRWHPDKFLQAFGSRLPKLGTPERDRILKEVLRVSQCVNEAKPPEGISFAPAANHK